VIYWLGLGGNVKYECSNLLVAQT
jgi:hypothetical protein